MKHINEHLLYSATKSITKMDAILSLEPSAKCYTDGINAEPKWPKNYAGTIPTSEEIDAEVIRLGAEYDALEYARNRATEYPALAEQLDEIYHNGINAWKAVIKVTKDKYPKG